MFIFYDKYKKNNLLSQFFADIIINYLDIATPTSDGKHSKWIEIIKRHKPRYTAWYTAVCVIL